jgi:hypothetical protein
LDLGSISIWLMALALVAISFGGTAGTIQGATGVSAQIVAPYHHGRNVPPEAYAFLVAFSFLTFSVAQLGIGLAGRISNNVFQKLLLVTFVVMEIKLLTDVLSQ